MTRLPSRDDFYKQFDTEEACWQYLRRVRWGEDAFTCPRCGEDEHWGFITTRRLFECYDCHYQCSIKAGTILQDSKLSLLEWFRAAYEILATKQGISVPELARTRGLRWEAAHYLKQKIMTVVQRCPGGRDDARELFGMVEADDAYVGSSSDTRGRGTDQHVVVACVEDRDGEAGGLVLEHASDASKDSLPPVVESSVREETTVHTDGLVSYDLPEEVDHKRTVISRQGESAVELFPLVHTVFSNLKKVVKGTHRGVSRERLAAYLDLFAYRFDHRGFLEKGLRKALRGFVRVGPHPEETLRRDAA